MNQHTRIRQTDNLLAYRPEMVRKQRVGRAAIAEAALVAPLPEPVPVSAHSGDGQPRKSDLELVEALMIAATNAIYPASFDDFRETRAGYDLFAAIYALTGTEADRDIMIEVGMFAGVVKTEDL